MDTTGEWPTQSFITGLRDGRRKRRWPDIMRIPYLFLMWGCWLWFLFCSITLLFCLPLRRQTQRRLPPTQLYSCWVVLRGNKNTATTTPPKNANINQRKEHDKGVRKRACFLNVRINIIIRWLPVIIIISTLSVSSAIITRLRNFWAVISEWME